MFNITLKNLELNYTKKLTGDEPHLQVVRVDGLAPVPATLNIASVAGMDGGRFNSSKLETRNIVITLKLNDANDVRKELETYFATKSHVRVFVETGKWDENVVYAEIDGYVNSFECDIFSASETAQISIICPDPFFKTSTGGAGYNIDSTGGTVINNTTPFENGVNISVLFSRSASEFKIYNVRSGQYIELVYQFAQNDILRIDTHRGERSVKLQRGTTTTTLFSAVQVGSTFWSVMTGANLVKYDLDYVTDISNAATVTVVYSPVLAGV